MAMLLRQSTTVTLPIGPVLDWDLSTPTEETGLTIVVEVSKNNGAFAARNSATAITHDSNGWYRVELNTTDTNTLGPLIIKADNSVTGAAGYRPVHREFMVVPAHVYDGLVAGTDNLQVDAVQWAGAATATNDVALVQAPTNFAALAITAGGAVTVGTNSDKTGYTLNQGFPANFSSMAITAGGAVTAGTVSDKTGYALTSGERSSIADAVGTRAVVEAYAADGAAPTLDQALCMLISKEFHKSISGVTMTTYKLNGSTVAMTFTLNSSTAPTSITRAT